MSYRDQDKRRATANAYQNKRYREDPEYRRKRLEATERGRLRRDYGLDTEAYLGMFEEQEGKCLICKQKLVRGHTCVDHDHSTGEVRGLLCRHCNAGLGQFHDSPTLLLDAAQYLLRHQSLEQGQ